MVTAAYLSFTVAMVVVLLLAWRKRADAVEALERSKADARRGRHAQALAADMANIAQALVLSFDVLDVAPLEGESREAFDDARSSLKSFMATLRAAQYLVQDEPMPVAGLAEGWVRVAVAGARGEGVGVRVEGLSTGLRVHGPSTEIATLLEDLVLGLGATLPPKGYVQVELFPDAVAFAAPRSADREADPRVQRAIEMAARVGWDAALTIDGERTIVRLASTVPPEPEDEPRFVVGRSRSRVDA